MNKKEVIFDGIVKDVRIFQNEVHLFIDCKSPLKVRGRVIRFDLNEGNCITLSLAARAYIGAEASICRMCKDDKYVYVVDFTNEPVSADLIDIPD